MHKLYFRATTTKCVDGDDEGSEKRKNLFEFVMSSNFFNTLKEGILIWARSLQGILRDIFESIKYLYSE